MVGKGEWATFSNNSFSIPWNIRIEFIYPDYLFTLLVHIFGGNEVPHHESKCGDRRKNRTLRFPLKINQRKPANIQSRE